MSKEKDARKNAIAAFRYCKNLPTETIRQELNAGIKEIKIQPAPPIMLEKQINQRNPSI
jgi:hypothetical protein